MKLTLRQLQVFDAVATHGSVTGAARHLAMSQSTVSSTLKDLQIILQRPLFSPDKGRTIRMTEEGKRLKAAVRSALVGVEEVEREARGLVEGRLLIGASEFVSETVLPGICVAFHKRHPNVEISLETRSAKHLFEKVGMLDLDAAVIEIYPALGSRTVFPNVPELEIIKWMQDDLCVVAAPDHPLARADAVGIDELADWPWCFREPDATYSHVLGSLIRSERRIRPSFVCTSEKALHLIAMQGGGLACLSRRLVADDLASGRLVRIEVRNFQFGRQICLVRPKGLRRTRIATEFDDFLLGSAAA